LDGKIRVQTSKVDENYYSRRRFLVAAIAAPFVVTGVSFAAETAKGPITIASPNGQIQFQLLSGPRLNYQILFRRNLAIETSKIGILVDGMDVGEGAVVNKITNYRTRDDYQWRGGHSKATDHCNGAHIAVRHNPTKTDLTIEVRVFDDGVAFRYLLPDVKKTRIPDEATSFTLPTGSTAWFHDFVGHYEGTHVKKSIEDVKDGEWAAPPVTIKLPRNNGYVSMTEAALIDYAGMGFRADGKRGFQGVLGHALPVSHPYELRYTKDDIARLAIPASFSGSITTPWRVVMIGADLNTLVNCDIVNSVSPPPDKKLFPDGFNTKWLRPGRAVWRYLDGGDNTLDGMKEFSSLAGELGFEHNVVEGIWHRWTEEQMRELVDHSKKYKVGIWFWEHSKNLKNKDARTKFFEQLNRVGVVGTKIDFFDHEAKEVIDQYQALLREGAEHKIMLEFHGANKPAGESRTWPNEMSREAIRGLEYRSMEFRATHNTTLPFTRFLAGHADYTPVHFGDRRRETSWAHQIATAAVFTSPLMIYGAHPKSILDNPAVNMIKSIPSVWDETIALPVCEIGKMAAFARRRNNVWFLAILNGPDARTVKIPLVFLDRGAHAAMAVRDKTDDPAALKVENVTVNNADSLTIEMRAGGGFIARFDRAGV